MPSLLLFMVLPEDQEPCPLNVVRSVSSFLEPISIGWFLSR